VDVSQPYSDQALAIPFQKDNPAFESAVTNAMQRIKADGRLTALEEKWLKVPLEVTAEQ
jgi:ABC-type amino acid transport substrate-binding protein